MDIQMTLAAEQAKVGADVFSDGVPEGARRATGGTPSEKTASSSEVAAVAKRRKFTAAYMQRIVREADACNAPGAIGALLRREGLYSSHLSKWRLEVAARDAACAPNKTRGPKPDAARAVDRRVINLELANAKLTKQLERAKLIIGAQKKLCDLLGLPTEGEVL
jgi:transposase-like protein